MFVKRCGLMVAGLLTLAASHGSTAQAEASNISHSQCVPDPRTSAASPEFVADELPNGLRYILDRRPGADLVVGVLIGAGERDAKVPGANAPHVIEHVAVSPAFYAQNESALSNLAGKGSIKLIRATTGMRSTEFLFAVPGVEDPNALIEIVGDILFRAPLTEANIRRERQAVLAEVDSALAANLGVEVTKRSDLFGKVAPLLPQAAKDRTFNLTVSEVQEFYRTWYRTDLATVVVTGDINITEWRRAILHSLGCVVRSQVQPPRTGGRVSEQYLRPELGQPNRFIAVEDNQASTARYSVNVKFAPRQPTPGSAASYRDELLRLVVAESIPVQFDGGQREVAVHDFGNSNSLDVVSDDSRPYPERVVDAVANAVHPLVILKRFGIARSDLARAKLNAKKVLVGRASEASYLARQYMDLAHVRSIRRVHRRPNLEDQFTYIDAISYQAVNEYLRHNINFNTDFDVSVVAPSELLTLPNAAAVDRGIKLGLARPAAKPHNVPLPLEIAPPIGGRRIPRLVSKQLGPNRLFLQAEGGPRILIERMPTGGAPAPMNLLMLDHNDYSSTLKGESGQYFRATARFWPSADALPPRLTKEYLQLHGVSYDLEVREDRAKISIGAPFFSLREMFEAARFLVKQPPDRRSADFTQQHALPVGASVSERAYADNLDRPLYAQAVTRFRPDTILISGDFDMEQASKLASGYLADFEAAHEKTIRASRSDMTISADDIANSNSDKDNPSIFRTYSVFTENDKYNIYIQIATEIMRKLFFDRIRDRGGYYASVDTNFLSDANADGSSISDITFFCSIQASKAQEAGAIIDEVVEIVRTGKFTTEDFRRAKANVAEMWVRDMASPKGRNELMAEIINRRGNIEEADEVTGVAPIIEQITEEDIKSMAKFIFNEAVVSNSAPVP